jgi:hypothetical protein
MNRCVTDHDAILEIDRPHRHNFDWYALLARTHLDDAIRYDVFFVPSSLTTGAGRAWTLEKGAGKHGDIDSWNTEWKDGVRLELRSWEKNGAPQRRLYVVWDLAMFKASTTFFTCLPKHA